MTPIKEFGKRFYRASGAAKGGEILNRVGLTFEVELI